MSHMSQQNAHFCSIMPTCGYRHREELSAERHEMLSEIELYVGMFHSFILFILFSDLIYHVPYS